MFGVFGLYGTPPSHWSRPSRLKCKKIDYHGEYPLLRNSPRLWEKIPFYGKI